MCLAPKSKTIEKKFLLEKSALLSDNDKIPTMSNINVYGEKNRNLLFADRL
jgi:hypothetical protein